MRAIIVANGHVDPDERYGHLLRADDLVSHQSLQVLM